MSELRNNKVKKNEMVSFFGDEFYDFKVACGSCYLATIPGKAFSEQLSNYSFIVDYQNLYRFPHGLLGKPFINLFLIKLILYVKR
jgi:hypothetical protein